MPKVGVVLAGCGAQDGSEIHESVLTLLFLDRIGTKVKIMALEIDQFHVVNQLSNHKMDSTRNTLLEAARIARGNILPIRSINNNDLDALIFPLVQIWQKTSLIMLSKVQILLFLRMWNH